MKFERAMTILARAKEIGQDRGIEVSVAIVDAAGHPVLVARGKEDAWHGPYMAQGKARLAAAFRRPTAALLESWAERPLYPQSLSGVLPFEVTLNPGGYPLFEDGECIGAIGVGGSNPENDDAVAAATVAALGLGGVRKGK